MAITPLRQYSHYAITPVHPLWPLHQYDHYAIMPLHQYGHYSHYASTAITPLRHYASTAITAIMPLRHYGHYAITPVRLLCHSPHSLASVKDMYVEMGFPLNLYQLCIGGAVGGAVLWAHWGGQQALLP
jgi:hypothetical protein